MLLDSITEDAPPVTTKRGGATRKTRGSHALKAATLKVSLSSLDPRRYTLNPDP
jgi:hypothetical protein